MSNIATSNIVGRHHLIHCAAVALALSTAFVVVTMPKPDTAAASTTDNEANSGAKTAAKTAPVSRPGHITSAPAFATPANEMVMPAPCASSRSTSRLGTTRHVNKRRSGRRKMRATFDQKLVTASGFLIFCSIAACIVGATNAPGRVGSWRADRNHNRQPRQQRRPADSVADPADPADIVAVGGKYKDVAATPAIGMRSGFQPGRRPDASHHLQALYRLSRPRAVPRSIPTYRRAYLRTMSRHGSSN